MLKVAFHPEFVHPLPANHRFPMEKYDLLPTQLLYEGTLNEQHFFQPESISMTDVLNVHDEKYINRLFNLELTPQEERISGFKHSSQLINREKLIMEGTRMCAEMAFSHKAAMNIAGGTHHAYTNRGEGFCLMNDNAIAAHWLLQKKEINKILIVDLDVHQGNGTAQIFQNNPAVFTFSMHGENNYPLKKEKSDVDVPLSDGMKDAEYLYLLEKNLDSILSTFQPDFVFYQCGVDIIETDKLGKLGVTIQGCKQRDKIIFETVRQMNVPIVCNMGGGYSPEIKHIIEAHANTFRTIQEILF